MSKGSPIVITNIDQGCLPHQASIAAIQRFKAISHFYLNQYMFSLVEYIRKALLTLSAILYNCISG